jgi:hypothetical protein
MHVHRASHGGAPLLNCVVMREIDASALAKTRLPIAAPCRHRARFVDLAFLLFVVTTVSAQERIISRSSLSLRFDERYAIKGEIYSIEGNGTCWMIRPDGEWPTMELGNLPAEYQVSRLRVAATVHIEDGVMGECLPFFKLIVDDIERAR